VTTRQRIHHGLERWTAFVYDRAGRAVALSLVCVVVLASQIPRIEIETDLESFLHGDDPLRVAYDAFRQQFGRDDFVLLTLETPDIFAAGFLEKLRDLHRDLDARVPYVDEITSLVNARETRGEGDELIVGELLEDWPETEDARADARERALGNRLYRNLILSEDAGVTVVALELSRVAGEESVEEALAGFENEEAAPSEPAVKNDAAILDAVREVVAEHEAPDFRIHVTGMASLAQFLQESLRRDMSRFTLLAILAIAALLGVLFRSAAGVLLPLVVVILSLVSTLGLMAITGVVIAMPTQILPSFLLAVGVGGAVHLLAIFFQRLRAGHTKREAVIGAARHSGLAIVMTSLTTAGAMASFASATMAPVAGLGICAPGGVMVALFLTLTLLPALIALFPVRSPAAAAAAGPSASQRALMRCGEFAVDHRGAVLLVSGTLLLVALFGTRSLYFSHAPLEWFAQGTPFRVATELTNERMGGSINLEVLVDTGVENGMHDPDLLRRLGAMQAQLASFERNGIRSGKSISLADTLQEIHQALNENRPEFYTVPSDRRLVAQELLLFENAGSDDLEDVVDARFQVGRVTLRAPLADAIQYIPYLDEVEADFERALGSGLDVRFTGLMPILSGTIRAMMQSLVSSYTIAFFVIAVLLVLLIGDVRLGLAAMIPNVTPILLVLGAMGYAGLPIDGFTLLVGSIAIGLAVDDTIHFMHNFRGYLEESGDARVAVRETLATAGQAMLFTTLVLSSGFAIYTISSMDVLAKFGLITAAAIALAFVADILLAPALMTWLVEERR
jgi:predicted RND superfamily exporter protein